MVRLFLTSSKCWKWERKVVVIQLLFSAKLSTECGYYLDHANFTNMSYVYYLDQKIFIMSNELTIWIVLSFIMTHTKFLIVVGRALCTKNQSHEYKLDCVKSISEP